MAKKKSRTDSAERSAAPKGIHSRTSPQELRWGDIDVEQTEDQHAECEVYLAQIGKLLSHTKSLKLTTIHMDGYTHLTKATGFLKKFGSNLQDAINNAQLQATLEAKRNARG